MNPEFLDNMSWEMAEVYGAITDQILINLAKYFPYYQAGNVPKSAFTYQAAMLAQMGQVNRETVQIIRNGLKDADKALNGILEQTIIDSVRKAEKPLWKAVQKGIYMPPQTPVLAPNQYRAFQLYYKQAAEKLNLVNTVMLESTQQAYRNTVADIANRVHATQTALDIGAGETVTGVSSWNQAVKHSIDRLKDNGITGFIDHGGHRWSAEAYTAMDIRTTVYNTSRAAVWETNQNFGNDLYSVSYHNGARPLCYPWQNKVISSTNNARVVTDLDGNEIQVYAQSDTSYGEPAGLFGINCKHYPTPFIPGVSMIDGQPQSEEENAKSYAESQQQRGLERKIREEKRDLMMMKAQGAPDDIIKAQRAKIRQTDDDIDAFCAETGRARRQNREGVYTTRDFPDAKTYDVTQFTNEQKERIERYYREGGEQKGFTFGQMTQNTPVEPSTPTPAAPSVPPATSVSEALQPIVPEQYSDSAFVSSSTRKEAEEYAKRFASNIDYSGISLENCNTINETLTELTGKYPINKLDNISQVPQGSVARAKYDSLEINGKKLGSVLSNEQKVFENNQAAIRTQIDSIKSRYQGKAKLPWSAQHKIDKLEQELKFSRYGVQSSYQNHVKGVVTHEYGHIIADQYFGMSNDARANPHYNTNWSLRNLTNRWIAAYDEAWKTGDIFKLSKYGSKNAKEFFAESFASYELGESLPNYVESLLKEVLAGGIL